MSKKYFQFLCLSLKLENQGKSAYCHSIAVGWWLYLGPTTWGTGQHRLWNSCVTLPAIPAHWRGVHYWN